jgi:BirA family biotin operon repressor/biotin-[acetyl-CoA-carboxylase] ligase
MDDRRIKTALQDLPLGGLRYLDRVGSTNDVALAWAAEGAADFSLVISDEQTAGRGRGGRHWYTPAGAALAFSLVLRPCPGETAAASLFSALGALAVVEAMERRALRAQIKWPNDVLLRRRKVCGVLTEMIWLGDQIDSLVIGVGVNVALSSVPPADRLNFPATCLETELGQPVDRLALLRDILVALEGWRPRLKSVAFHDAWEERLAFRGETVEVWADGQPPRQGQIVGLGVEGGLLLRLSAETVVDLPFGEVHLRPVV